MKDPIDQTKSTKVFIGDGLTPVAETDMSGQNQFFYDLNLPANEFEKQNV